MEKMIITTPHARHVVTVHERTPHTLRVSLDALPVCGLITHTLTRAGEQWLDEVGHPVCIQRPAPTGATIAHPEKLELTDVSLEAGTAVLTYAIHDEADDQEEDERVLRVFYPMDSDGRGASCGEPELAVVRDAEGTHELEPPKGVADRYRAGELASREVWEDRQAREQAMFDAADWLTEDRRGR